MNPVGSVAAQRGRPGGSPRQDAVAENCRPCGLPGQHAVTAVADVAEWRRNMLGLTVRAGGRGVDPGQAAKKGRGGIEPGQAAKGSGATMREGMR